MLNKKNDFVEYLNKNIRPDSFHPIHPGIQDVFKGVFNKLPENPSENDWNTLALMINGYDLSKRLGLGDMSEFVNCCLNQFNASGKLPKKSIELWICLFGFQRLESRMGYPLNNNDKKTVISIYEQLRKNLLDPKGVNKMIKSLNISDYRRFYNDLLHRYWRYQEKHFQPVRKYFDQPNLDYQRPPVFLQEKAHNNILTPPNSDMDYRNRLFKLINQKEHHVWFRSMNSSQALALSVLGNLYLHDKLSILTNLTDDNDDGLLLCEKIISFNKFCMEQKINYLNERRSTSIDAFIPGEVQIAIECKFTEFQIGSCSRPRLTKYDKNYCDGSYSRQGIRKERCPLTENKVMYWEYIPYFFKWNKEKDIENCPLHYNYQMVRNILAAGVKKDSTVSSKNGYVILIYDDRNPACHSGGKIFQSYYEIKEALISPEMLRKISWQKIIRHMRAKDILPWLTRELNQKYGF